MSQLKLPTSRGSRSSQDFAWKLTVRRGGTPWQEEQEALKLKLLRTATGLAVADAALDVWWLGDVVLAPIENMVFHTISGGRRTVPHLISSHFRRRLVPLLGGGWSSQAAAEPRASLSLSVARSKLSDCSAHFWLHWVWACSQWFANLRRRQVWKTDVHRPNLSALPEGSDVCAIWRYKTCGSKLWWKMAESH